MSEDGQTPSNLPEVLIVAAPVAAFVATGSVFLAGFPFDRGWVTPTVFAVIFYLNAALAAVGSGYGGWRSQREPSGKVVAAIGNGLVGLIGYVMLSVFVGAVLRPAL